MGVPESDIMDIGPQEPCPFCGCIRILRFELTEHRLTHSFGTLYARFGCDRCGASVFGKGNTSEEAWVDAEKKWNRRNGMPTNRRSYWISHRRGLFGHEYYCNYCGAPSPVQTERCHCCKAIMLKTGNQKEV